MTPGRYLRARRIAARLTIDQVAIPATAVLAIEHDCRRPTDAELCVLSWSFRFDLGVLCDLMRGRSPRLCRTCACSELDACIGKPARDDVCGTVEAVVCHWIERDLCSACADRARPLPEGSLA